MSHHGHNDFYERRQSYYMPSSALTRGAVALLVLIGLVTFSIGMAQGLYSRVWGALLFNTFFFFMIALGGSVLPAIQDVLGAKWARPILRLAESYTSFIPVAGTIFIAMLACIKFRVAGAHDLYSWIANPASIHHFWGKRTWLVENFWLLRDVAAILVIIGLSSWQVGMKTARDRAFVAGHKDEAAKMGIAVRNKLRYWSAPILVTYSVLFTLLAFDLMMSLAPTWFSTLWGGWLFAVMMQTLFASLMITMWSLKGTAIGQIIGRQQFHDVGKLMHGFSIFFAYLTYAHILTYWYGNMPEETEYFLHRLEAPWKYIVFIAPLISFVLPLYVMIPKASKWTKMVSFPIAFGILCAQWFTYMLIVMPEIVKNEDFGLPMIELGLFFGIFGLFLGSVFAFGSRNPMVALADPLLHEALAEAAH